MRTVCPRYPARRLRIRLASFFFRSRAAHSLQYFARLEVARNGRWQTAHFLKPSSAMISAWSASSCGSSAVSNHLQSREKLINCPQAVSSGRHLPSQKFGHSALMSFRARRACLSFIILIQRMSIFVWMIQQSAFQPDSLSMPPTP